ncbi:hypothetical protein JYT79_03040 [Cardiobacterium sp. AH-315-I02]|nr:hypothetical protein [Cardiobacterium sp. AH-315-I02]
MKIVNDDDNLVYDDANAQCNIQVCASQDQLYAFITALDIGMPHNRLSQPRLLQYWGKYSHSNPEKAILEILHSGGKWPTLDAQ